MTKITLADLEHMPSGARACLEAREWFAREFPNGAPLEDAWRTCPSDEWRVWFACNWLSRERVQVLAWRFVGQAFRFAARWDPALAQYADNVTAANWREARADAYAAYIPAAYAAADAAAGDNAADAAFAAYATDADAQSEQVRWCAEFIMSVSK